MTRGRVDVHHHFFPASIQKEKLDPRTGFRTPPENLPWTPQLSLKFMDEAGIDTAILSLPALASGSIGDANRTLARQMNRDMARIRDEHPTRFGFFATLPFLQDVRGALAEIAYASDQLKADGVAISSSYGEGPHAKYVGDRLYEPIWAELNARRAVVFLHGTQTPSSTPHPNALLGLPIVEVPNETFKAASHLVITGTKCKYPDIQIILAHMGGSTPFLSPRVAVLSNYMGCKLTPEEILAGFKSFYFDTALSSHEVTLSAMQSFVTPDPVSREMANWYTQNLEQFYGKAKDTEEKITFRNALNLFPRLQG
ncbi:hypothetical protein D9757_002726 [Collybiopsis confluens]|uniref:Amidohydrolase-related domain-containing protein n=1 Tax=Collybiopsis confluens TaxID=2823264 RepID=A0A8H5HWL9_9AGAR|nr:hypothetical protein D9757_002726 [Collybiopsis confluens]